MFEDPIEEAKRKNKKQIGDVEKLLQELKEREVLLESIPRISSNLAETFVTLSEKKTKTKPVDGNDNEVNAKQFPKKGSKAEKVKFIFQTKMRALNRKEIEDAIYHFDGSEAEDTLKSFYHILRNVMVKNGELATKKIGDSNLHTFYALPEFIDDKLRLKADYLPAEATWRNLHKDRIDELLKKPWTINK